ncbi:class I SAM-dependent methyltransferase [Alloiococcus sp. CFN-8]|uniref:class I SAM-dependent methyltransferase n=1 Tax=Alloiococcus sp. CFN-8 TaxID=3416081 RepID=UPI003CECB7A4
MDEVKSYYNEAAEAEWNRLSNPYTQVEFQSTLYLIEKYFPKGGKVLDIGSGPGRYSIELLKKGYKVTLLDISEKELDIAKNKIQEAGLKAEGYHAQSALDLDKFQDEAFDIILIMGPLYHLHKKEDRLRVLKEGRRLLKKGGVALISYINSWGCLKAGVEEFPEEFKDKGHFLRFLQEDMCLSAEESFTEAYFTTPPVALKEIEESGLKLVSYGGAESFLAALRPQLLVLNREQPLIYRDFVAFAAENCELPQYRDATEHLHIIAIKES